MNSIQKIDAIATFAVRQAVLRAGKSLESCKFDGDDLESTIHFGYFEDHKLIAVASLFRKSSNLFENTIQFQLRGMAVLASHQKLGIGALLFNKCNEYSTNYHNAILWFNARTSAVPFYQRLNCKIVSNAFIIADVGEHYIMIAD